jgi:hypothetical protein
MNERELDRMLGDLDAETAVPAHLDARVLARASGPPGRRRWPGLALSAVGGALATAAVAALLVAGTPGPGDYRLIHGAETVSGEGVWLLAGDVRIEVDGEARITVEPQQSVNRTTGPEVDMGSSHWLAAAGGAAVTVAVITGAAMVWPSSGGGPLEIRAGESWSSEAGAQAGGPTPLAIRVAPGSPEAAAILSGDLEGATQAALAAEVERLRMESALLKGQLEKYQGSPEPWPTDIAADLRPEAFEATVDGILDDFPDAELVRVDCQEYPCLAVIRARPGAPDTAAVLKGVAEAMGEQVKSESGTSPDGEDDIERGVMMSIAQRGNDDGTEETIGVLGIIDGSRADPDRQTRTHQRLMDLEQDERGTVEE